MAGQAIDIFVQALKNNFISGYNAVAEPAPIEQAMTVVPSTGRIENYAWMNPAPGFAQWQGFRRYGKIGAINYKVPNVTYDGAFEILNEDIDDDQTGGYMLKSKELGENGKNWPGIQCLQTLALGQTTPCFDGTNFFASTHTLGGYPTGGNIITGTAAASDGVTHAMAALVVKGAVKPLLWQNREGPQFKTDAGSETSSKSRVTRAWADLRGAAAFGYWWDAVLVKWANTPTLTELLTTLGTLEATLRQFTMPKNLGSDVNQYVHGQTVFDDKNLVFVCSSRLTTIVRQAMTLSLISQTENIWKGFAKQVTTGYLDAVV